MTTRQAQGHSWSDDKLDALSRRVDDGFKHLDRRIRDEGRRLDQRIDDFRRTVDERFEQVDGRLGRIETRLDGMDERFVELQAALGAAIIDLNRTIIRVGAALIVVVIAAVLAGRL